MTEPMFWGVLAALGALFLMILYRAWRLWRLIRLARAARRVWDEFGGECGNDSEYCRWSGDPETVGKCYCQETAWRHASIALEGKAL